MRKYACNMYRGVIVMGVRKNRGHRSVGTGVLFKAQGSTLV